MPVQYAATTRTARLERVRTDLGANFSIQLRSGAPPADPSAAATGTLLATLTNVNFAAASGGAMALTGGPFSATGAAAGTAGHFRMMNGATCIVQGTVATSGGDMTIDNTSIAVGQNITLSSYTLTEGNA